MDGYPEFRQAEFQRSDFQRLAHENAKLRSREAKEKSQAVEYTEKAIVGVSAVALGFGMGVLNAQNGATAEAPYQVGGSLGTGVAIDSLAAGLGAIAILAMPTHGPSVAALPVALGAGAGALAIWGLRTGQAWQQARATGTTTAAPAATTTAGAFVGWGGGGMGPRPLGHGAGHYGGHRNAYVDEYSR